LPSLDFFMGLIHINIYCWLVSVDSICSFLENFGRCHEEITLLPEEPVMDAVTGRCFLMGVTAEVVLLH
jgi:hypothetical protein